MTRILALSVFLVLLGVWTWKLLEPYPLPESVDRQISEDWRFWLAKSLHAGVYAFLTVFAALLPIRRAYFLAIVGVLALHGVGTEIGQTYVPSRHGCVRDVIIDWAGVSAGLFSLWVSGFGWRLTGRPSTAEASVP
jgi:VanZ family protein